MDWHVSDVGAKARHRPNTTSIARSADMAQVSQLLNGAVWNVAGKLVQFALSLVTLGVIARFVPEVGLTGATQDINPSRPGNVQQRRNTM